MLPSALILGFYLVMLVAGAAQEPSVPVVQQEDVPNMDEILNRMNDYDEWQERSWSNTAHNGNSWLEIDSRTSALVESDQPVLTRSVHLIKKNECFFKCVLAEWSGEHESVRIDGDDLDTRRGRQRHASHPLTGCNS